MQITLTIPELPPGPNASGRAHNRSKGIYGMHWSERRKLFERWRWLVLEAVGEAGYPNFGSMPVRVEVLRRNPSAMDWDNFGASLKPVMDALVHCRVLDDDNPDIVQELKLRQERTVPARQGLLIEISTLE